MNENERMPFASLPPQEASAGEENAQSIQDEAEGLMRESNLPPEKYARVQREAQGLMARLGNSKLLRKIVLGAGVLSIGYLTEGVFHPPVAEAQAVTESAISKSRPEARDIGEGAAMERSISFTREIGARLAKRVQVARAEWEIVARATSPEREARVEKILDTLRSELLKILDELGENSEAVDTIERARTGARVLKEWFEWQTPDYPNRDAIVSEITKVLVYYDELRERLTVARILIQEGIGIILSAQVDTGMLLKANNFPAVTDRVQEAFDSFDGLIGVLSASHENKK